MNFLKIKNWFNIDTIFIITIILKAINGALEIIGGIAVIFVSHEWLIQIVNFLARRELSEDPTDIIANYFTEIVKYYAVSTQYFISVYLLAHGILNLFLVFNVLKGRHWAYLLAIAVYSLFGAYQIYAFTRSHSLSLLILTVIDAAVITFTVLKYRKLRLQADTSDTLSTPLF